jgi:methionyl-tRNA formyltransferase
MRLVFAGTPAAAVPSLETLAASAHDVVAVVTRPDAPVGRKRVLTPSPVAATAAALGVPTIATRQLDEAATTRIAALRPDLGVIVAYGGLVREPLLSAPAHGWINLHFSLLPRWRGAAPVQHALIAGDDVVGAAVFRLVAELDAGDVYDELRYPVPAGATASEVLTALATRGADLLRGVVDAIAAGAARATPQRGAPTFAPKLGADDGRLRWDDPADTVLARHRGTTPEPGAFTTVAGVRVKILDAYAAAPDAGRDAALGAGSIALAGRTVLIGTATTPVAVTSVQPAGKAPMAAADWYRGLRGHDPKAGS